jgi:hypothetical protein
MIHDETYYTCDRCGKRFDPLRPHLIKTNKLIIINQKTLETSTEIVEQTVRDIDDKAKCYAMDLVIGTWFNKKNVNIELCGNCRKEYDKLMKKFMENK